MAFKREEGTAQTREQEGGADFVKEEMLLFITVEHFSKIQVKT